MLSVPIVFGFRWPLRVEAAWKLSVVGEPRKNAKTAHSTVGEPGLPKPSGAHLDGLLGIR